MSQIITEILKQGYQRKRVLACSFFTMQDSYRPFEKYQRQLLRFLKQIKVLRNFEFRIYTDDTGKDFCLEHVKDPAVSIIKFDCPEFREGLGHTGTFGTLVRFLPLFEEHEIVWIADIDIPDAFVDPINLSEMLEHQCDFKISSRICYDRKIYGRLHTIEAGRFISRIQIPKQLLTRFINKLLDGSYAKELDALNAENKRKNPSRFPYGVDELFLNYPVYDWMRKRDYKVFVETDMLVTSMLTQNTEIPSESKQLLLNFYYDPLKNKKLVPKLKLIYKKYIPLILNLYPCLQVFLDKLDSFKDDFNEILFIKSSEL
jgi:hypothetical protein